jgi:hypothetical protein
MRSRISISLTVIFIGLSGCNSSNSDNKPVAGETANTPQAAPEVASSNEALSKIINEATTRFSTLDYDFNEDLLKIMDDFARYFATNSDARKALKFERQLPKLDEAEEISHFQESVKRWETKTGKTLRAEVDRIKKLLEARDAKNKESLANFNREFSTAFDDFVKIEVDELRERRNRWIHDKAKPVIEELKSKNSAAAASIESTLNNPPYQLPAK